MFYVCMHTDENLHHTQMYKPVDGLWILSWSVLYQTERQLKNQYAV